MAPVRFSWWSRADWLLPLAAAGLLATGLPFLQSAAARGEFGRQLRWLGVGLAAMVLAAAVDHRRWIRHARWVYGAALALLAVALAQPPVADVRRFIRFGDSFGLQPAETMKFALVPALAAALLAAGRAHAWSGLAAPVALALAPAALIARQPDLGSAATLAAPLLAMLFVAGARPAHLAAGLAAGAAGTVPLWHFFMAEYQKRRIWAFWNPWGHDIPEADQARKSLMAIGTGGLGGRGLGQGTLNDLGLLPARHNDFIFAVVAEEGGLAAAGLVLGLSALLALLGFRVAGRTSDPGGRLMAAGFAAMLGGQAFLNIAVATGLVPTTGITLPLVSYGGSSLVVSLAMVGVLLGISGSDPGVVWSEPFLGRDRKRGEL